MQPFKVINKNEPNNYLYNSSRQNVLDSVLNREKTDLKE